MSGQSFGMMASEAYDNYDQGAKGIHQDQAFVQCCSEPESEATLGPSVHTRGVAEVRQLADTEITKLEIGGGATIGQQLCWIDQSEPGFYRDEPAGLIYINYCLTDECEKILSAGKREVTGGFTSGLRVGNP